MRYQAKKPANVRHKIWVSTTVFIEKIKMKINNSNDFCLIKVISEAWSQLKVRKKCINVNKKVLEGDNLALIKFIF